MMACSVLERVALGMMARVSGALSCPCHGALGCFSRRNCGTQWHVSMPTASCSSAALYQKRVTVAVHATLQAYLKETGAEVSIMPLWTEGEVQPAGSQLHGRVAAVMLYMLSAV